MGLNRFEKVKYNASRPHDELELTRIEGLNTMLRAAENELGLTLFGGEIKCFTRTKRVIPASFRVGKMKRFTRPRRVRRIPFWGVKCNFLRDQRELCLTRLGVGGGGRGG